MEQVRASHTQTETCPRFVEGGNNFVDGWPFSRVHVDAPVDEACYFLRAWHVGGFRSET